jgi:hypothetical protein
MPYMGFVRRQPCIVRELAPWAYAIALKSEHQRAWYATTSCEGRVEADHMGARGVGQKADDRTCVPMCHRHHMERHAHAGSFRYLNRDELRAWRTEAIARTQAAWENR